MYQVTVKNGRKIIERKVFRTLDAAQDFMDIYEGVYEIELKNLVALSR